MEKYQNIKKIENEYQLDFLINTTAKLKKLCGKVVVIKYGGNAMISNSLKSTVMKDIAFLQTIGIKVVLVHGGGPEINSMLSRLSIESKFLNGLRCTDSETMEIVQMVLAGKINKEITAMLIKEGGYAAGISGVDSKLLLAEKINGDLGFTGEIISVDTKIITTLLEQNIIPVISTIALGENGSIYNVNADTASAKIAAALSAQEFILLTNVQGILEKIDNPDSVIPAIKIDKIAELIENGIITKGMIPKVECCAEAIKGNVPCACIIDGRIPHSLFNHLLDIKKSGTIIYK